MKLKHILVASLLFLNVAFDNAAGLTDAERKFAVNKLEKSRDLVLANLAGLTAAQIAFKADSATWSIAQCVEHIAITENNLFAYAESCLKTEADPTKRSEVKMSDQAVFEMIENRSEKFKAQEPVLPIGRYGGFDASLAEFKSKRSKHIKYINSTTDDLRNHYNDWPFGKTDAYQTILFMAGHSQRHAAQIAEIIKNPGFPQGKK